MPNAYPLSQHSINKQFKQSQQFQIILMEAKPKRKSAGFIRNSSFKALPTFKAAKQSDSEDFSSFEAGNKIGQDSDSEFSPYHHKNQNNEKISEVKVNAHRSLHKDPKPAEMCINKQNPKHNSKATTADGRKGPANRYKKVGKQDNYGLLADKQGSIQDNQIEELLKRRADIQQQLEQIGQLCNKINKMRSPLSSQPKHIDQVMAKHSLLNKHKPYSPQSIQHRSISHPLHSHKPTLKPSLRDNELCDPASESSESAIINKHQQSEPSSIQSSDDEPHNFNNAHIKQNIAHYKDTLMIEHNRARKRFIEDNQMDEIEYSDEEIDTSPHKAEQRYKKTVKVSDNGYSSGKQRNNYAEESESQEEQEQEEDSSDGEELIQLYPKQEFNKRTFKKCVTDQSPRFRQTKNSRYKGAAHSKHKDREAQASTGVYRTKGGICFDLDVNQFTAPQAPAKAPKVHPRKPNKASSKQQILKRRQTARNYDKQARRRVFGY